mmetsp:Transcript_97438/g.223349  ORF Transcript_97438/g.223349 Transcript_97438/m.223349 type:complete len:242 (-) Transcript_97438:46-771(-)
MVPRRNGLGIAKTPPLLRAVLEAGTAHGPQTLLPAVLQGLCHVVVPAAPLVPPPDVPRHAPEPGGAGLGLFYFVGCDGDTHGPGRGVGVINLYSRRRGWLGRGPRELPMLHLNWQQPIVRGDNGVLRVTCVVTLLQLPHDRRLRARHINRDVGPQAAGGIAPLGGGAPGRRGAPGELDERRGGRRALPAGAGAPAAHQAAVLLVRTEALHFFTRCVVGGPLVVLVHACLIRRSQHGTGSQK